MRPIEIVILAGGQGTRLRPLTIERPKTLCKIGNASLLERLLRQLDAAGLRDATLTLPPETPSVRRLVQEATPAGFNLDVQFSSGPYLGTVAEVRQICRTSNSTVMVIYGDSFLSADFGDLLKFHRQASSNGAMATILYHEPADLYESREGGRTHHGVMQVDAAGRVSRFEEKPLVSDLRPGFDKANAAVFIVEPGLFERPGLSDAKDFSYDVFERAVGKDLAPVYAMSIGGGYRHDVGSLSSFFAVSMLALSMKPPPWRPARGLQEGVWLGDGGDIGKVSLRAPILVGQDHNIGAGAELGPDVIVGDRCRIESGARIRRSVVMEDCSIGPGCVLDRCIIGPNCKIFGSLPPSTVLGADSIVGCGY